MTQEDLKQNNESAIQHLNRKQLQTYNALMRKIHANLLDVNLSIENSIFMVNHKNKIYKIDINGKLWT